MSEMDNLRQEIANSLFFSTEDSPQSFSQKKIDTIVNVLKNHQGTTPEQGNARVASVVGMYHPEQDWKITSWGISSSERGQRDWMEERRRLRALTPEDLEKVYQAALAVHSEK